MNNVYSIGYIYSNYRPCVQGWRKYKHNYSSSISPSIVSSYSGNGITQIPDCFHRSKLHSTEFQPMESDKVHACPW